MGRKIWAILLLLQAMEVLPQERTDSLRTYVLDEVSVSFNELKEKEIGLSTNEIDSHLLAYNLGASVSDLLRFTSTGSIRSYGPSGISSPTFRGTSSAQTAIVWNGVTIQNPLTGQQDLQLFNASFFDKVSIQKGGASSLYGTGAIGGTLQLNSQMPFNQGIVTGLTTEIGSFGRRYGQLDVGFSNSRISSQLILSGLNLNNDYPFIDMYSRPVEKRTRQHAGVEQMGLLQQNDLIIGNHAIGLRFWYQQSQNEVPNSTLSGNEGTARQADVHLRVLANWNMDKPGFSMVYKQGVFNQNLDFTDVNVNSSGDFNTWLNQLSIDLKRWDKLQVHTGVKHEYQAVSVTEFGDENPVRNLTSFHASISLSGISDALRIGITGRQTYLDGSFVPFTPMIGIEYQVSSWISLRGNASRNYRIPTFNDLYWNGGGATGNPDLKSELSWSHEMGMDFTIPIIGKISTTVFNNHVDNWILWQPDLEGIWTPGNVKKVWSRGVEASFSGKWNIGSTQIRSGIDYQLVKTTNREIYGDNTSVLGNQLPYTPEHSLNSNQILVWKASSVGIIHTWVGSQFSDESNNPVRSLPSYYLLDTFVSQRINWRTFNGVIRLEVRNLLNRSYENRRGYPMYGRNYSITLSINFNQSKS